jgi:hypothetical protein
LKISTAQKNYTCISLLCFWRKKNYFEYESNWNVKINSLEACCLCLNEISQGNIFFRSYLKVFPKIEFS